MKKPFGKPPPGYKGGKIGAGFDRFLNDPVGTIRSLNTPTRSMAQRVDDYVKSKFPAPTTTKQRGAPKRGRFY